MCGNGVMMRILYFDNKGDPTNFIESAQFKKFRDDYAYNSLSGTLVKLDKTSEEVTLKLY